ncbi:hypothetical protein [Mycoplasma wenyonii]|nr:hypothetical protein [Mycoplasma wenyonii]
MGTIGGLGGSIAYVPWKNEFKDPAKGYYVLASWEDGTEWTVSSKNFFKEGIYNKNGIGFNEVDMKLGNQKIEKNHQFFAPIDGKGSLLVKYNGRNFHYILEDGKEQPPGHLRINENLNRLTVKKYSDEGFNKWKKGWNTINYDLEFDKCRFKKDARSKDLITVTCQWGYNGAKNTISRTLSSEDFRY